LPWLRGRGIVLPFRRSNPGVARGVPVVEVVVFEVEVDGKGDKVVDLVLRAPGPVGWRWSGCSPRGYE